MSRTVFLLLALSVMAGCKNNKPAVKRIPLAEVGNVILYYDEVPSLLQNNVTDSDSAAIIQNYINKWAKRQLLLVK
ncbi:MAG TPA: hypothetical protein VJ963_10485, partial [Bacteroidales bacterium]|nr:hypothetical protein [Bacteroidales bacterium]